MAKQVTLAAGDVDEKALEWLKAHGAQVEGIGLLTITLPETALVYRGNRGWDYAVSFYNVEGNDEDSYLDIETDIDAYDTRVRLMYNADPRCTCKGKGCALCVEELARIERGENPYAHHTSASVSAR